MLEKHLQARPLTGVDRKPCIMTLLLTAYYLLEHHWHVLAQSPPAHISVCFYPSKCEYSAIYVVGMKQHYKRNFNHVSGKL